VPYFVQAKPLLYKRAHYRLKISLQLSYTLLL
jgi:hypothetical protein